MNQVTLSQMEKDGVHKVKRWSQIFTDKLRLEHVFKTLRDPKKYLLKHRKYFAVAMMSPKRLFSLISQATPI